MCGESHIKDKDFINLVEYKNNLFYCKIIEDAALWSEFWRVWGACASCMKCDTSGRVAHNDSGEFTRRFNKVTHCLFDLDGTVLDSEVMYHKMIKQICEKYGRVYTKQMQIRMYGVTDREICVTLVRELHLPISADEFEKQLETMAQNMLPSAPLLKGAERLLSHLHSYNIPLALATNSTAQAVRLHACARPILFGMFQHKVSITDPEVDRGKPHPDIYLVAAARFTDKPKPIKCLVFEDSAVGVEAAREAGMQVVMVPDRRLPREHTRHATLVVRSLLEFRPELFGLPPFHDQPTDRDHTLQ